MKIFLLLSLLGFNCWAQTPAVPADSKPFSRIIVMTEIDPSQFEWSDLGLETEKSLVEALESSWLKWLREHLSSTVSSMERCDQPCQDFYRQWFEASIDELQIPEVYQKALILKVNLRLRKSTLGFGQKFEWEGRTVLMDTQTKRMMEASSIPQEARSFEQSDQKLINSALASLLYRSALPSFLNFRKALERTANADRAFHLVIQGHRRMLDVLDLIDLLKSRGIHLDLNLQLETFSKDQAQVTCYSRGEEKAFTDLLSSIKELKSSHSYTVLNELSGVKHVIKLIAK